MFPFFSYPPSPFLSLLFLLLFLLASIPLLPATHVPDSSTRLTPDDVRPSDAAWTALLRFLDAGKGTHVAGMADLKRYLRRFGYISDPPPNNSFTDLFDDEFQRALVLYQRKLGLSETGVLDHDTMGAIVSPRCGVQDFAAGRDGGTTLKTTRRYAYFYGQPRWVRRPPMLLTYAFSPANTIDYVSQSDVRAAFSGAFARWSAVIPVNFTEAEEYSAADIKIGWYRGDHGDGESFDGVLGVLAHAFSPDNGRFHLDAAERWAVDFKTEKSQVAVDLESVATHEIGHVLGLAHSSVKEAIMYPSLSPRTKKLELQMDDVEGIQALYGSNPNYRLDSKVESDVSSSALGDGGMRKGVVTKCILGAAAVAAAACFL